MNSQPPTIFELLADYRVKVNELEFIINRLRIALLEFDLRKLGLGVTAIEYAGMIKSELEDQLETAIKELKDVWKRIYKLERSVV